MTLDEECRLSYYERIATLNKAHGVFLVQHTENHRIYVEKNLTVYDVRIYQYLKEHPVRNTPRLYEVIEDGDTLHIIEEYISGESLAEILKREKRLPRDTAVNYTRQLCQILQDFHNAKPAIIHRDIKPSNVIVTPDGTVKLIDMNAAKHFHDDTPEDTRLIGTTGYAAPEQYGFGVSSVQTDIYALGILLNVMLTGFAPKEHIVEGQLKPVIEKCTALEPKYRYQSVSQLSNALGGIDGSAEECPARRRDFYKYLPPGFRTGQPSHIVIAILAYVMLFTVSMTLTVNSSSPGDVWFNRLFIFIIGLAEILFSCNYLDIWDYVHISGIKNPYLRILCVIALDAVIFFALMMLMIILENTIYG